MPIWHEVHTFFKKSENMNFHQRGSLAASHLGITWAAMFRPLAAPRQPCCAPRQHLGTPGGPSHTIFGPKSQVFIFTSYFSHSYVMIYKPSFN